MDLNFLESHFVETISIILTITGGSLISAFVAVHKLIKRNKTLKSIEGDIADAYNSIYQLSTHLEKENHDLKFQLDQITKPFRTTPEARALALRRLMTHAEGHTDAKIFHRTDPTLQSDNSKYDCTLQLILMLSPSLIQESNKFAIFATTLNLYNELNEIFYPDSNETGKGLDSRQKIQARSIGIDYIKDAKKTSVNMARHCINIDYSDGTDIAIATLFLCDLYIHHIDSNLLETNLRSSMTAIMALLNEAGEKFMPSPETPIDQVRALPLSYTHLCVTALHAGVDSAQIIDLYFRNEDDIEEYRKMFVYYSGWKNYLLEKLESISEARKSMPENNTISATWDAGFYSFSFGGKNQDDGSES